MKLLNYLLELNLALAMLVPVVWLCLRNETAFAKVRVFLLLTLGACWLLPAVQLPGWSWSEPLITVPPIAFSATVSESVSPAVAKPSTPGIPWTTLLLYTYLAGAIFVGARLLFLLIRFSITIRNARASQLARRLLPTSHLSSFAFLGYIFQNQSQPKAEANIVLTHEIWHVRLGHSYDLLALEVTRTVCWWNPAFYLLRTFLREVHEFQADEKTTARYSPHALERVLIENALRTTNPGLNHAMFSKPIFKRIAMIHAPKKPISIRKLAIISSFALTTAFWIGCQDQVQAPVDVALDVLPKAVPESVRKEFERQRAANPESKFVVIDISSVEGKETLGRILPASIAEITLLKSDEKSNGYAIIRQQFQKPMYQDTSIIYTIAEKPAQPLRGYDQFKTEVAQLFQYPASVKETIEGKVFVEFIVNQDGQLSHHKLVKGIHPDIDAEVLRALMLVQRWQPAEDNAKIVRMKMVVPIIIANEKVKGTK